MCIRDSSKRGSRRNIAWHYDLGNDFYGLWLDPSMTYSAALFEGPGESLQSAQDNKYRRMAELAAIGPDHHVLEVGCGWGGFCSWAAREIGCRVTAITISQDQYDYAAKRLQAEGLNDRVELRFQDYRELDGNFDRLVSIEMLEAVGEAYWPTYFAMLRDRLRPGGRAARERLRRREGAALDARAERRVSGVHGELRVRRARRRSSGSVGAARDGM